MTKLDHTSTKALVADLNRNKGSMFTCTWPDGSNPGDPWWLVSVVDNQYAYDINICVKYSDGTTGEKDCFLSHDGVLRFHKVPGSWILMVANDDVTSDDSDTSLHRQLNKNLRGIFR